MPFPRPSRARTVPPPLLLGAHVSIAGGVDKAIDRALGIGCTAMQIFVKNNMQWFAGAPFPSSEVEAFHARPARPASIFGHSGYMINLAATNPMFLEKSRRALREELERADQLGLPFLVLHPGAHLGAGVEPGLLRVVESLDAVFASIPSVKTRVALETTAGQGTCLGAEFEHLAFIFGHVAEPKRLCVCIDTAHLFDRFERTVGMKHLAALHINDSKTALGSRVDRHEHIGKGRIGLPGFRWVMRARRLAGIPKVLETPKGREMREDVENMAVLRSLAER